MALSDSAVVLRNREELSEQSCDFRDCEFCELHELELLLFKSLYLPERCWLPKIRPGLESGISGSGGRRLSHWANRLLDQHFQSFYIYHSAFCGPFSPCVRFFQLCSVRSIGAFSPFQPCQVWTNQG